MGGQAMNDLRQQLRDCLRGRVCFMGMGNIDYGDDGFGVRLAEELVSAGMPEVVVAGTSPERSISRTADGGFEHLIFLDAVEFGGAPGSVVFLNAGEMTARFPLVSTHKISLALLAKLTEANGATRAWLLGVQPQSIRPERGLTPAVHTTLVLLREMLLGMMSDLNGELANSALQSACESSATDGGAYQAECSRSEVSA
jgi:hydrogenase maturation protease